MHLTSLYLFTAAAWSAVALASINLHQVGHTEFNMGGVLLPRQQQGRTSLQTFTGALGGASAAAITKSGDLDRPFEVDGDTFRDFDTAANRACDNQKNLCANMANSGTGAFKVGDCDQQSERCKSTASSASIREFAPPVLVSSNAEFDFFCDNCQNDIRKAVAANPPSASTADGEASPELPPLPAPRLPERVLGLLRTPPHSSAGFDDDDNDDDDGGAAEYRANQWGSPYPPHLRNSRSSSHRSLSSDASEDSPLHRLELQTPFLRPAPPTQDLLPEVRLPEISAAATVLANRARRVAHGITEGWIRQHTAGGTVEQEKRHWFSDGDSENSSLSDSFSGDEAAWLGDDNVQTTPKASRKKHNGRSRESSRGGLGKQSSSETLRQSHLSRKTGNTAVRMTSAGSWAMPDNAGESEPVAKPIERPHTPTTDRDAGPNGYGVAPDGGSNLPTTPSKAAVKRAMAATTPRLKKKVPWRGKNILVLLPRDEERGQPGKNPIPLSESNTSRMLRSWQQLGYNVDGFDLYEPAAEVDLGELSQSRGAWPDPDDLVRERNQGDWRVLLPDLNAWKQYVDELNEAKLRALGVSFGDEEPPPLSISPASTTMAHLPPLPFSPPLPTSSASSNHAMHGFPFPGFVTSASQSPGIPAGVSPGPFGVKYNPRASISIPSPHAWSPQLMLQQHHGHRVGSPSLANLSAIMTPTSPFSPDGMLGHHAGHQRHQSLQYPTLPHQFQPPVRASPRLQELREVEEEPVANDPPKSPEQGLVRHNASDSLQREIDEAEYHLEEQMRSQLDNDEDYSPHNDNDKPETAPVTSALGHAAEPLVQFAPQKPHQFAGDTDGIVLHHPRPHSRGHSLSQKFFTEDDVSNQEAFKPTLQQINAQPAEDDEIETNPSNMGTPVQNMDFSKFMPHQRGFSTASNPWIDNESGKPAGAAHKSRPSHGSVSSFSKLNVEAPEFKFNPTSTFKSGAFSFSNNAFQPMAFNMGVNAAGSSLPSLPTTGSSKINVNAPVFSPGRSEFSFSSSGPKFRPDAPAFTPHSLSNSLTSPVMSGAESVGNRGGSIFGKIDINDSDLVKSAKISQPAAIVPPAGQESPALSGAQYDADGRPVVDESRIKRARANVDDGDAVPLFAEPTKEDTPVPESRLETSTPHEDAIPAEDKSFDESNLGLADMTMSSTMVSETTDTKATVSPSELSPDPTKMNWAPFEFKDTHDMQSFSEATPFGTEPFHPGHKKSLSATATAFVPGAAAWVDVHEQPAEAAADELVDQPADQSGVAPDTDAATEGEWAVAADKEVQLSEEEVTESIEKPVEEQVPSAPALFSPPQLSPASKGLSASRYAQVSSPPPPPKRTGLAASRFAAPPSPVGDDETTDVEPVASPIVDEDLSIVSNGERAGSVSPAEPTMADIDEVMRLMNENPDMGVNRAYDDEPQWDEPSPTRRSPLAAVADSSPSRLLPPDYSRSDAPSPSQADYHHPAAMDLEDPFVDPSRSGQSVEGAIHRLNGSESLPASDWGAVFSEDEQTRLESRVAFFDGRVNELVGGLLTVRLNPLERTLDNINHALSGISRRAPSSRRERGSVSGEMRESDADDEDDDVPGPLRNMSPRRDRRMDQIRAIVLDAFATDRRNQPNEASPPPAALPFDDSSVLKALEEMKEQFGQSLQPALRSEDLRSIVEDVVERRIPPPQPTADKDEQVNELQARIAELEQRLRSEETRAEAEISARRAAENRVAEVDRELHSAVTKIEVESMNNSAMTQRIADLEGREQHAGRQAEEEVNARRAAEDRLSEVQRLLRISSEEETRLRELVDEKDQKIKLVEAAQSKSVMRLGLLEAGQSNARQSQSETQNRINTLEAEAREARKETQHWRSETDRIVSIIQRRDKDLAQAVDENKAMHKLIDTLGTQLQENERVRENWRSKFISMQNEMADATREITEENARRAKKEQALLARQEVLEARLQAEARTRERIETELERLEMGERQGMRAVAECKRLEGVLGEMRTENHKLHQNGLRYQAEFQEARESGAREVQRTRDAMQAEVENANHQVNVAREELEDQMSRLRAQLDQVKLDADTAKARHDMLLEEAQNSKQAKLDELLPKHQNEIEDLQARYERQLNNTTEDAQRAEQNLLERLSISTSKSEYLQDKVAHLEEKLEIAKEAARAAALAAKSVTVSEATVVAPAVKTTAAAGARQLELPEKISPQALRESIMVLQEQLQQREQAIEDLELRLSKTDPEAGTKISKRDDEIIWLRELLAVRHSDLQDIIGALGREDYDKNAVKDAAIRLKANLQMEEQERERAMNGGSAINLPSFAANIRDAATPRVAQAVGPLAAAWGSWRKARDLGSALSSPAPPANGATRNSTPSRARPAAASSNNSSLLGGLLTPPTARMRQTPTTPSQQQQQPTAFASTGRRFTTQDLANRPRPPPPSSASPSIPDTITTTTVSAKGKAPASGQETPPPPRRPLLPGPVTPPMMRSSAYDDDAQAEEFDDAGFFED
ncbi:hypothetical protein C8A00DRAFT_14068 [Chaetomidium leptoderma]|uniref:Myosin class II heavy chain n=1 Tax=Chaetomidium leptoderma TaxID=669021 RepID=A0AAN6VNH7_9PEZI|nr:hypothetical protein C8A00DRAFT_14068 [Chaetomidium leptoderma]